MRRYIHRTAPAGVLCEGPGGKAQQPNLCTQLLSLSLSSLKSIACSQKCKRISTSVDSQARDLRRSHAWPVESYARRSLCETVAATYVQDYCCCLSQYIRSRRTSAVETFGKASIHRESYHQSIPEKAHDTFKPDVCSEGLAEVDVPEAVGELEGAAEGEVTLPSNSSSRGRRCAMRGARRQHSTAI